MARVTPRSSLKETAKQDQGFERLGGKGIGHARVWDVFNIGTSALWRARIGFLYILRFWCLVIGKCLAPGNDSTVCTVARRAMASAEDYRYS